MPCACCPDPEYGRFFNRGFAARSARRYRRRGLYGTEQALVDLAGTVSDASVLEVGGGVGAIQLELLGAGAARATSVELSDAYEQEAAMLLLERGFAERVARRVGDFAATPDAFEPADVVVLHRVVCCYPDMARLVGAAAAHARQRLLLTYPQERRSIRLGTRAANAWLRLRRCGFRTYAHPVAAIEAAAAAEGLTVERRITHGFIWESASLVRL